MNDDLFNPPPPIARKTLYPHQVEALERLFDLLASGKKRPIVAAPTGSGKTLIASRVIEWFRATGKRVLFVAPHISLIDQTVAAFESEGIRDIGVMQADHPRTNADAAVIVATLQTLARRRKPEGVGVVIVDECHNVHKSLLKLMRGPAWLDTPFIGFSATPWPKGLGRHYDALISVATVGELIEKDFLAPFVAYAPAQPDLSGVRTVAGEFNQAELSRAVNTSGLIGDIVETWKRLGENRPTLAYCVDRAHAKHVQQRFLEAGISAGYIDCFVEREERNVIFERFRRGEFQVVCNVSTLTTGVDLPFVSCVIDAHPTKSEMRYVQVIGRGLRKSPGKKDLIILDHAGNSLRLGLVTDIRHETLDDGKHSKASEREEDKREPLPKLCESCKAVVPRSAERCPQCGALMASKSLIVEADGRLIKLGSTESGEWTPTLADKTDFFAQLKYISNERQYKPGWAAYKFKEKFGHWPNGERFGYAMPTPPTLKTRQWVRSRQIAFAKSRQGSARHAS